MSSLAELAIVAASVQGSGDRELYLCGHCANRLWSALTAQGSDILLANARAVAPQAAYA
jgi:hypothetical protein